MSLFPRPRPCRVLSVLAGFFLLPTLLAPESVADCDGGTPGFGGLVPTISVGSVVAGDNATVNVGNISSAATAVYVGFSLREGCRDVSAVFGPGARLGPALVDVPGSIPPFRPIFYGGLGAPSHAIQRRIPAHWASRNIYIQALVADPFATGGFAFSRGIGVRVEESSTPGGRYVVSGLLALPSPRSHVSAEFDVRTGLIHVFGPDVTVIDPSRPASSAIRVTQEVFPVPRVSCATVTNAENGLVYVFGGTSPTSRSRFAEIFAFDYFAPIGQRLILLPDPLPSGRSGMAAVFEPTEKVTYLFGGITDNGRPTREILRVNPFAAPGAQVTVLPDQLPAATDGLSAVYDSRRRTIYVAGGDFAEIFEFDYRRPAGSRLRAIDQFSTPRRDMAAVFDAGRDAVFFIGGMRSSTVYFSDIVRFSPGAPAGARLSVVASLPSERGSSAAVYDGIGDRILVIGGYSRNEGLLDRVIEYRPPGFVRTLGGFTNGVQLAGAVLDPRTGRSYVFDLQTYVVDSSAPFGDEIRVTADAFPTPRRTVAAVWDGRRNVAYLFGGLQESNRERLSDIFEFDPSLPEGARLRRLADVLPIGTSAIGAAFDSSRGHAYLFGGTVEEGRPTRQILKFDPSAAPGTRVTTLADTIPVSASSLGVAYEETNDSLFVFGDGTSSIYAFLPWAPSGSRVRVAGSLPGERDAVAAVTDTSRGVIHVFGGRQKFGHPIAEILEFDPLLPSGESVMLVGMLPLERAYSTAVYWPARDRILLFGGIKAERDIRVFEH